jgi:hypothetical protein
MKNKYPVIMEYIWLISGILLFLIGIKEAVLETDGNIYLIFGLSLLSLFMFILRRYLRKSKKDNNPE